MIISDVCILPLPSKHYSTDLRVTVLVGGEEYNLKILIAGYAPHPSERELAKGWDYFDGMDHTESETHLELAHIIESALKAVQLGMSQGDKTQWHRLL
jgi:hypothetical protein